MVGNAGWHARLAADVGVDCNQPPSIGWRFFNWERKEWTEDASLTCSGPSTLPTCSLTLSLSGEAKEAQAKCEGEYKSTGLMSMGREVNVIWSSEIYLYP